MTTLILSNGSKWLGDDPDGIDVLLDRLGKYALDPMFEEFGNFIRLDPGARTTFWGNFVELSAVFRIESDDPDVVQALTAAIRANQETPAYLAARRGHRPTVPSRRREITPEPYPRFPATHQQRV